MSRTVARSYDIAGKIALVTGAGQGIGRALARELHWRGTTDAALDVDEPAVAVLAEELGADRALALTGDVRERDAMADAVERVVERFGRLDIVIANAGVAPPTATLRTIDPDEYDRVIGINQTGVFNTIHPAIEPVIASRGHMVIISSVAAFVPGVGGSPYMISKAAVEQLGRALRLELAANGASAGVAHFGFVETGMTRDAIDGDPLVRRATRRLPPPLRRRISADEAARAVVDGIARRAPRTIVPPAWRFWALLRGVVNLAADGPVAAHRETHAVVRELEARGRESKVGAGR